MATSTIAPETELYSINLTNTDETLTYFIHGFDPYKSKSFLVYFLKYLLRLTSVFVLIACPWANFQLIKFFQLRAFYKESSAKWYIIFKAVFDTIFMLISIPGMFFLTFDIDIIHQNRFICKFITYMQYLSDDLISILLTWLCLDRMIRITCGYHLRKRFSLTVCMVTTSFFLIFNVHHIVRLRHSDGFCHRHYSSLWDYNFDIYYSYIYISVTWTIIFIASINLSVSVCCDRARNKQLRKQQPLEQNMSKISVNEGDSDRLELIHSTDDWEESAVVTIEPTTPEKNSFDQEQQDDIDLQITISVLITSAIFLACNLPNFIIFIMRTITYTGYDMFGYVSVYISYYPLFIAHTINYFIFNHLAARLFPKNVT